MKATELYCTIISGTLIQHSASSLGGAPEGLVDRPFVRNGKGEPTLHGTAIVGALVSTLRKIVETVPKEIAGESAPSAGTRSSGPSLWQAIHSHPITACPCATVPRQGVGIRQDTGARAKDALFDAETLPKGTPWPLRLVIDDRSAATAGINALGLAILALGEWTRGRCWIGADVARGMGWMRLNDLRIFRLQVKDAALWPDAFKGLEAAINDIRSALRETPLSEIEVPSVSANAWWYAEIRGRIPVGVPQDGWGLEALAIGGHAAFDTALQYRSEFLKPASAAADSWSREFISDKAFAMTDLGNAARPIVPGGSLRGPVRHESARLARRREPGALILDPNIEAVDSVASARHAVDDLFGDVSHSAGLLIQDAELIGEWTGALIQHHAEDEFSGGAFGPGKFDRCMVLDGTFEWLMMIEAPTKKQLESRLSTLEPALKLASEGHLPIGGSKWRGAGWLRWEVDPPIISQAGQS